MEIQPDPQRGVQTGNKFCTYAAVGFVVFAFLASTGLLIPLIALVIFGGGAVGIIWGIGYLFGALRLGTTTERLGSDSSRRVPPFGPNDPWSGSGR